MTRTSAATIIRIAAAWSDVERELYSADQEQEGGDHRDRDRNLRKFVHFRPDFTKINHDRSRLAPWQGLTSRRLDEAFERIEGTILPCIAMMLDT